MGRSRYAQLGFVVVVALAYAFASLPAHADEGQATAQTDSTVTIEDSSNSQVDVVTQNQSVTQIDQSTEVNQTVNNGPTDQSDGGPLLTVASTQDTPATVPGDQSNGAAPSNSSPSSPTGLSQTNSLVPANEAPIHLANYQLEAAVVSSPSQPNPIVPASNADQNHPSAPVPTNGALAQLGSLIGAITLPTFTSLMLASLPLSASAGLFLILTLLMLAAGIGSLFVLRLRQSGFSNAARGSDLASNFCYSINGGSYWGARSGQDSLFSGVRNKSTVRNALRKEVM